MSLIDYKTSGDLCVLRLDAPPVNAITPRLLNALVEAIDRANADNGVKTIVVAGDDRHFSAGADTSLFKGLSSSEDAITLSQDFQDAFDKVEASAKPVVAALAGKVMGGALELAMACRLRVCDRGCRFGMPEVTLGINPGAGGTQRLPRLIGVEAALKMLLTGRPIGASEAQSLGLVDAVCDANELVARAGRLAATAAHLPKTRNRTGKIAPADNEAAIAGAAELLASMRPELIAPQRIVEAVRVGLSESFDTGLREEQEAFAACMDTPATRCKLHLFFATQATSKLSAFSDVTPRTVGRAAVVGMGSMGTGIAQALIMSGVPVVIRDASSEALDRGLARIRGSVLKRVEQGRLSADRAERMLGLICPAANWQDLAESDLVIEAVFEDVAVKRAVIDSLEDACSADTIIATNTSTISLDLLAEGMRHPGRLVGMHFFNPAQRMPLVEVIRRDGTSPETSLSAVRFAKRLRKTPVLVRNRVGFVVNRMFLPYVMEAFRLLEEGASPRDIDRAMLEFGFPMGPFVLIDMAGLDILVKTVRIMNASFPSHGTLSSIAAGLVEQGHLGQKSGSGVYRYEKGNRTPHDSDTTGTLIREARGGRSAAQSGITDTAMVERLVLRMVNEAFHLLEEGIARDASDIDVATVLGMGFPDFRGGVLRYAHDLGIETVVKKLEELATEHGERFLPPERLGNTKGR